VTNDDRPKSSGEDESSVPDQRFRNLFGVSRNDLIAQGVDPDGYLRENLRRALRNREGQDSVLSERTRYRLRFFVYAKWSYVCAFVALIVLLLSGLHSFANARTGLIVLSCAVAAAMFVFIAVQIFCASRYRAACRREGIQPNLYGSRKML
jgi:hypothetical protein